MTNRDQLRTLLTRGLANLKYQVEVVAKLLSVDRCGGYPAAKAVSQAQEITHQIKGTGGSIGFLRMAAAATALDDALKPMVRDGGSPHDMAAADGLLAALEKAAGDTTCEESTLYDVDLASLAKRGV